MNIWFSCPTNSVIAVSLIQVLLDLLHVIQTYILYSRKGVLIFVHQMDKNALWWKILTIICASDG